MTRFRLAEMTQLEFNRRIEEPVVILLPLGSQESQGPHCPMGDFRLVERIADLTAERSGALVAPGLPFGHADFFRDYPGGIQLRPETFTAVLTDMLTSFLDHGRVRLLVLNGHTTNAPLISQVTRQLRRQTGVAVPSIDLWASVPAKLLDHLFGGVDVRGHGGEPLTSVTMHLCPGEAQPHTRVADNRKTLLGLPIRGVSGADFDGLRVNMPVTAAEVDPLGQLGGSAELASAAKGAAITEDLVIRISGLVAHLQTAVPCPPPAIQSGETL
ncbi:creatininase family protein [Roseibium algae]|uniref:Creatininase family protein n=1 Tax=Roseibium algae TaxID=3123038 RepID=A0ABU8THX7_9HYPH